VSVRIVVGDALERLRELPDGSMRCCVTSPPYWRQRDYGVPGQLGLEATPEEYVTRLVAIFAEVRRVVTDDGSLWLNLGDKWASGGNGGGGSFMAERGEAWAHVKHNTGWRKPPSGYKDKDLIGLPWMVAFALRADGWYLRQANVWAKPNGMPESVRDRSTASHEYVFQLSKRNDYFYDSEAARTPLQPSSETRLAQDVEAQEGSERANGGAKTNGTMKAVRRDKQRGHSRKHEGFNARWDGMTREQQTESGSNLRSVWWIAPAQYREAHFAVMPNALATICIRCGSANGDTILDPFGGAGTTGLVADRLGRHAILIELNPTYAAMAERRIHSDAPLFHEPAAPPEGQP
jgi:DNA modification methylase